MPTPGFQPDGRSDLLTPNATVNMVMITTTETDRIAVVTRTTTSRTNKIRATTDKVNDIMTSHGDDETPDPKTSRGPEVEAVGPGVEPLTTIIPHRLRHRQEAVLAGEYMEYSASHIANMQVHKDTKRMLPVLVIKAIDTARKNCLWRGNNPSSTRKSLTSWDRVCTPKEKGGLGVINLRVQNTALLLKHMVKFYNGADLP
uniref:OSJNBb0046K02.10 protein n=1 Tax=Oryza sativa subsp. japonica TaxID=39947 RepID=Q7XK89_ORYSJ|nr:OSJNBb0046K02.10 [Oryza sativa Japonica Group]